MGWLRKPKSTMLCSFCHKSDREVDRLIAGAGAYICGRCVESCVRILKPHQGKKAPDSPGWEAFSDEQLLKSLAPVEKTLDAVRRDLQNKVEILRHRGVSWENIGNALGVSRQAAWERFS